MLIVWSWRLGCDSDLYFVFCLEFVGLEVGWRLGKVCGWGGVKGWLWKCGRRVKWRGKIVVWEGWFVFEC